MKTIFISFSIFSAFFSTAQKIERYYDYSWKECQPNEARFYSMIEKTDSGWHRDDYFIYEKKVQMDGTYADTACKTANGRFYYFHSNGVCLSTGKFVNGKKEGLWQSYHLNGMMSDSTFFVNDHPLGIRMSWFEDGSQKDSANWNADGACVQLSWFENGYPQSAGRYIAWGQPIGKWQFFHANGKLSALKTYSSGKIIAKQYFDEQGNQMQDTASKDRSAELPGGLKAWQNYILKGLYFPSQYKIVNADKAVVVVSFTIDENGNMTKVFVSTPFHPVFDRIAEKVIAKSPKWIPAIQHNHKATYSTSQPVFFAQE